MGIKISRKKSRHTLLSVIYRMKNIIPLSKERKLKLYLDLEWIFDRLAHEQTFKIYEDEKHPTRLHSKKFILDFISKDHSVLDLGCNNGIISDYISEKAAKVIGIDYDKSAIEKAKNKYKKDNLKFEAKEAFDFLSNQNNKFDVLILSHILEHLDNPEEFLAKFKNFFDYIYIEVPDFDKSYLNQYRLDNKVELIYSDIDHVSEFDREELKEMLKLSELSIIKEEYRFGVQKIWCQVNKMKTKLH